MLQGLLLQEQRAPSCSPNAPCEVSPAVTAGRNCVSQRHEEALTSPRTSLALLTHCSSPQQEQHPSPGSAPSAAVSLLLHPGLSTRGAQKSPFLFLGEVDGNHQAPSSHGEALTTSWTLPHPLTTVLLWDAERAAVGLGSPWCSFPTRHCQHGPTVPRPWHGTGWDFMCLSPLPTACLERKSPHVAWSTAREIKPSVH